ncbi:MAG: preprotein translocase subunit SecA [Pirellulales bacterium]
MEVLERIGEILGVIFGGFTRAIERAVTSLFGSSNARYIKKLQNKVEAINALETKYQALNDEQLKQQTDDFKRRLAEGESLDDLVVEAFAVCREAGRRFLNMRHYDTQMIGGMVLHSGNIAEMVTGEGKTLVATLPAYLNALAGQGVHVITVNDYLARRDMEWMGPLYMGLGLTVGAIQGDMDPDERRVAYDCDITYGTNNEFGFDYLRDNMKPAARGDNRYDKRSQQAQGRLSYAIIDEVDNILIDEARTPLIISGPSRDDVTVYAKADKVSRQLKKDVHFEVKEKEHTVHLNEDGVRAAEKLAGVESFYTAGNMEWPHLIDNSLKAHYLYKRDVNYVVQRGKEGEEVIIVDEFTGRLMDGRRWSDGLHQAVEAKEGVRIKEENQTLATITLQNFFKLYRKICGMTGTAMTEASEFWKIYKLDVIAIPTHRTMQRINNPDVIYRSEEEKFKAIADEIERMNKFDTLELAGGEYEMGQIIKEDDDKIEFQPSESRDRRVIEKPKVKRIERKGRPILVGTVSIEKSERVAAMLGRRGIKHEVLNAKHHQREAEIVAQAGRLGAVTIATNMAGRGTDIILGGNPEIMAWALLQDKYATRLDVPQEEWTKLINEIEHREQMKSEGRKVASLGGLHIIGTERHEARRIDLQLRGRCGRQGDPGSSRFYLSLEDDLMRIFAGEWVKNVLTRLGMKEGEAIESRMVSRRIEGAQKKVEERNFEIRKNLLEYDEVKDEQRKRTYGYRQRILNGESCKKLILDMIDQQIDRYVSVFLSSDYGTGSYAAWAGKRFGVEFKPREFKDLEAGAAEVFAKEEAERQAETQVFEAIEENLPETDDEDAQDWNWEALAKLVNTRWGLTLRERDLKSQGRDHVSEFLLEKIRHKIVEVDCADGAKLLEPELGLKTTCSWVRDKFGLEVGIDELRELDAPAVQRLIREKAAEAYELREIAYPVIQACTVFIRTDQSGHKRVDREQLAKWASGKFNIQLSGEELQSRSSEEIERMLIDHSRTQHEQANRILDEASRRVEKLFDGDTSAGHTAAAAGANGELDSLADWMKSELRCPISADELKQLDHDDLQHKVTTAVEDRYRREMRRMERSLVLEILDETWKDHLLAMDHLEHSVKLRSYAQVDPKVEFKREGMRLFEAMWDSVGEQVTDLIFRVKEADEAPSSSTWGQQSARHDSAPQVSAIAQQQQDAIDASQGDSKPEPIRNRQERVGRNEPCPCGSGKKFKNCCMRTK